MVALNGNSRSGATVAVRDLRKTYGPVEAVAEVTALERAESMPVGRSAA